jgi:hypothetical protein
LDLIEFNLINREPVASDFSGVVGENKINNSDKQNSEIKI